MSIANTPMSSAPALRNGPLAEIRLIEGVHYRREAFAEGFSRLGFSVTFNSRHVPRRDDVLVLWNRYKRDEMRAREYESSGAQVLITENAWLGPEEKDRHWFALSVGHHNGAGMWRVGDDQRWADMEIPLSPWREKGKHILVLPQRGMGEIGVAQPLGWLSRTLEKLALATERPILVRYHPGIRPHAQIDFSGTWCVVTWASGAALKAIIAGIPCFYELPHWVGAMAAVRGLDIERPFVGDRLPMLRQLAWAMWRADEIATGDPLAWLLCKSPSTSIENSAPGSMSAPIWRRGLRPLEIVHV